MWEDLPDLITARRYSGVAIKSNKVIYCFFGDLNNEAVYTVEVLDLWKRMNWVELPFRIEFSWHCL